MSVEVIDPGDYGDSDPFASGHGSGALPFETTPLDPEPYDEPRYEDIPEVRPSMEQRMSGVDLSGGGQRARSKPRALSKSKPEPVSIRDNYVYWRLEKEGEDWAAAYRRKIPGTQKEIAKLAKRGNAVLAETRRMGPLRAQHLQRLIDDANANEKGDAKWEPVYIDSVKISRKTSPKVECKSMDVILARRLPTAAPKSRKGSGELVNIINEGKPKDKDKEKDRGDKSDKKDKKGDKDSNGKESKSKDEFDSNDPFDTAPLFHKTGKPMDSQGVLEFKNGGLPDNIPPDRPIGAGARDEGSKDDKKDKKKKSRRKSRDPEYDEVVEVGDAADPPIDVGAILGAGDHPLDDDGPIAEPGRSRSRRRSKSVNYRRRSSAGWGRSESITYPPGHRRAYHRRDGGDSSYTDESDESHYGIGHHEELSSRTSNDTYSSIGRRGSHYEEGGGRPRVYKEHHRGPSRGPDGSGYYRADGGVYEKPARTRRYSRGGAYYASSEPMAEARLIGYGGNDYAGRDRDRDVRDRELMRRRTPPEVYDRPRYRQERGSSGRERERPVLHYPDELDGRRAERYMDESVVDEELNRREYEIRQREARIDALEQEEEFRRREMERAMEEEDRLREYGGRRDSGRRYYEDDRRSRGYSDDPRYDRGYRRGDYE